MGICMFLKPILTKHYLKLHFKKNQGDVKGVYGRLREFKGFQGGIEFSSFNALLAEKLHNQNFTS
jgi:hypothetical protein